MDDEEDVTTYRFRHMSAVAMMASALLHATVAMALVHEVLPQQHVRATEQAIVVTVDPPSPPIEAPPPAAADQAAVKSVPGATELEQAAAEPDREKAVSAPTPVPTEPDVALILPSAEPPPTVPARDFGRGAPPPAPKANLEKNLPPAEAPPLITGREFARTAPPAKPASSTIQQQTQAPALQQPIQEGRPRRAPQQHAAQGSIARTRDAPAPVPAAATDYSNHQAQQDYLWKIVRKLSQYRFYSNEESGGGLVIARLTIGRDGRLLDLSLTKSSGIANLDRQVMETIRRASPFSPLPDTIAADRYAFIVPVNYTRER